MQHNLSAWTWEGPTTLRTSLCEADQFPISVFHMTTNNHTQTTVSFTKAPSRLFLSIAISEQLYAMPYLAVCTRYYYGKSPSRLWFFFWAQFSRELARYMNIHITHAQYACYQTLYSAVLITDSFVKTEISRERKYSYNLANSRENWAQKKKNHVPAVQISLCTDIAHERKIAGSPQIWILTLSLWNLTHRISAYKPAPESMQHIKGKEN